jgi:oxygen-independent coproporphyrinogen-3 oxidase
MDVVSLYVHIPDHLSLYALTLEEHTPLAQQVARGEIRPPDDDLAADMYVLAEEMLAQASYVHYEISNWAGTRGTGGTWVS